MSYIEDLATRMMIAFIDQEIDVEDADSHNPVTWEQFKTAAADIIAAGFHRDSTIKDATPADLIQAAWDAAYPVPEGRTIPAGTPNVMKYKDGTIMWNVIGSTYEIEFIETDRIRTLEPLPPVIPDDCMAVWASLKGLGDPQNPTRCVWLRDSGRHSWRNRWNVVAAEVDLIDPKPVPEEER